MAHFPSWGPPGDNSKLLIDYCASLGQARGWDEDHPGTGVCVCFVKL